MSISNSDWRSQYRPKARLLRDDETNSNDWRQRYLAASQLRTDSASPKEQVIGLVLAMDDSEAQTLLQQLTGDAQPRTDTQSEVAPVQSSNAAEAARSARIKQIENANKW